MAKNDYDKDGDNDMADAKSVGKLYGGPKFKTGPGNPDNAGIGRKGSASLATGPARENANEGTIGHKAKGTSETGTKGDKKGEDRG